MAPSPSERLAAARAAVDQACQLLLSPTPGQMDRCAGVLETALEELTAFRQSGALPQTPQAKTETLAQVRRLDSSMGCAKRLLEGAAAFHANWIRNLAALCAGYSEQGQPARLERSRRLLVQG